jgi:ribonuclease HI
MPYILYTDGGARGNPGISGIGVAIYHTNTPVQAITPLFVKQNDLSPIHTISRFIGTATNNTAEWTAVIEGLEWLCKKSYNNEPLLGYLDSELVQRQMLGIYKVKHPDLKVFHNRFQKLIKHWQQYNFIHIPREQNSLADLLSNQGMDMAK